MGVTDSPDGSLLHASLMQACLPKARPAVVTRWTTWESFQYVHDDLIPACQAGTALQQHARAAACKDRCRTDNQWTDCSKLKPGALYMAGLLCFAQQNQMDTAADPDFACLHLNLYTAVSESETGTSLECEQHCCYPRPANVALLTKFTYSRSSN